MQARRLVVLAAGIGSRLGGSQSKPLTRVGGLTLLERSILAGAAAGFVEIVVVTGHGADTVAQHVLDVSRRRRVAVRVVHNDRYEQGNGSSVLAARDAVGREPFVLVMADHVFSAGLLSRLRRLPVADGEAIVAVDRTLGEATSVDRRDATKVCLDDGRVTAIGKELDVYDAFDVGAFVCGHGFFTAAARAAESGTATVTAAVEVLVGEGAARAVELTADEWWADVDTPSDRRRVHRHLLRGTGKALDGAVAARLNRVLSQRVTTPALLAVAPTITPNQVTFVAVATALGAGVAFALGAEVAAGVLLTLASVIDGSDGEVARLTYRSSRYGAFFDATMDRIADGLFLMGAAVYLAEANQIRDLFGDAQVAVAVTVVMTTLLAHILVSYLTAKGDSDLGHRYVGAVVGGGHGRDLRVFLLTLGALAAAVHPVLMLVTAVGVSALCAWIIHVRLRSSWWIEGPGALYAGVRAVVVASDDAGSDERLRDLGLPVLLDDTAAGASDWADGLGVDRHDVLLASGRPDDSRTAVALGLRFVGIVAPGSSAFEGSGLPTVSPAQLASELRRATRSCVVVDRPIAEVRHHVGARQPPDPADGLDGRDGAVVDGDAAVDLRAGLERPRHGGADDGIVGEHDGGAAR